MNRFSQVVGFIAVAASPVSVAQTNTFPASGNVGIGTTRPDTSLEVSGGGVADHADSGGQAFRAYARETDNFVWAPLAFANDGSAYLGGMFYTPSYVGLAAGGELGTAMTWLPNGDVGVGTDAPNQHLDVSTAFGITNSTGAQYLLIGNQDSGGTNRPAIIRSWNSDVEIGYGNSWTDPIGGAFSCSLHIDANGHVGIGTAATETPSYPLSVNGTIQAKEVIVQSGWSDYVLGEGYSVAPLSQVEHIIETEHHLPGIPSAAEVAMHGVRLGDMEAKLLAQVEELTLRQIKVQKRVAAQEEQILSLRAEISRLSANR